ncbi:trypsin-2-like [Symsagittifera roscoffensis]|uniref:trypsin-2-like n=1 Tax=Symsagittifera roscoffensis TaxID=84072 RepID=UPI00307CA400
MNSLNVLIILLSHFCSVQSWKLPELIRENETKNNKTFETRLKSDRGVKQSLRIIHGDVSNPGDYPFVVSLMQQEYDEMKHFCAGVIYNEYTVITSASCIENRLESDNVWALAGVFDLENPSGSEMYSKVISFKPHGSYKRYADNLDYDVAILKLSHALLFSDFIQPIFIPAITDKMICAGYLRGGVDTCRGDGGGPLVTIGCHGGAYCNYELLGIASYTSGCGRPNRPGVYTKMNTFVEWLSYYSTD